MCKKLGRKINLGHGFRDDRWKPIIQPTQVLGGVWTLTLNPFTRILFGHLNSEVKILVEPQVKFNEEKNKLGLHLSQTPKLNLELDGAKAVIDLQL